MYVCIPWLGMSHRDTLPLIDQLLQNLQKTSLEPAPCRIRSDRQTTSLTLTTGVCETGTKMRGASNMNIHYDVTGLLTAAWRSHSGQIVWAAWINCQLAREEEGGGGFWTHSTYTGYPGSAGGRQLDRWRCEPEAGGKRETFTQCRFAVGPSSTTLVQHQNGIGWTSRVSWVVQWAF